MPEPVTKDKATWASTKVPSASKTLKTRGLLLAAVSQSVKSSNSVADFLPVFQSVGNF
jgi:hypothetical protein